MVVGVPMKTTKDPIPLFGEYKLEKVALPAARYAKWPISEMKVGDSFCFPVNCAPYIRQATSHYAKRHGGTMKFTTRKDPLDPMNKARCWRLA